MYIVSAIIDYGQKLWPRSEPWLNTYPQTYPTTPDTRPTPNPLPLPAITREEFDELKRPAEAGRVNTQSVAGDVGSGQSLGPSDRQINERLYADFMEAGMQLEAMGMLFNAVDTMLLAERLFNYAKTIREELLGGIAP